jgi:hypothetical protein
MVNAAAATLGLSFNAANRQQSLEMAHSGRIWLRPGFR